MPPSSGVRIAVAGEDQAHRALVTYLADRVLLDEAAQRAAGWITSEALQWLRTYTAPSALLIVVHDTDGDRARARDLEQALALTDAFPVIVAVPHQDAEGWFVAGFRPEGGEERRRLDERAAELGFDPTEEPHRLTAHPNEARTDAKRVLRILAFDENASRPPSLEELPDLCDRTLDDLRLLERRGEDCGLATFLSALRAVIVPLFIPGPAGR